MIANRFRPMGLVVIGMTAAMGFYLISSRVASERTELEKVDRQILAARKQIRQLQTEIGTRSNMRQLERWNGEVLALTAPDASQYVQEAALGHLDRSGITDGPRFLPAQMVTAMVSSPVTDQAMPTAAPVRSDAVAFSVSPAKAALVEDVRRVTGAGVMNKLAVKTADKPKAAKTGTLPRINIAQQEAVAAGKPKRVQAVARIEKKLLDDGLLGELAQAARAEVRKR